MVFPYYSHNSLSKLPRCLSTLGRTYLSWQWCRFPCPLEAEDSFTMAFSFCTFSILFLPDEFLLKELSDFPKLLLPSESRTKGESGKIFSMLFLSFEFLRKGLSVDFLGILCCSSELLGKFCCPSEFLNNCSPPEPFEFDLKE